MDLSFRAVRDEITACTGLPVALDGVYRWVAFLLSRVYTGRPPLAWPALY